MPAALLQLMVCVWLRLLKSKPLEMLVCCRRLYVFPAALWIPFLLGALSLTCLLYTSAFDGELVLRGEGVISYSEFQRINEELGEGDAYKNPRNLCSGTVRQLNKMCIRDSHLSGSLACMAESGRKGIPSAAAGGTAVHWRFLRKIGRYSDRWVYFPAAYGNL